MSERREIQSLRGGRYVVVGLLGEGSQGATLDAIDKQLGRPVAVKEFRVRGAKSWKDVELAEREARVLSTISHANLPVYIDHFEEDGVLYLVMERIDGESLSRVRARGMRLDRTQVYRFLTDAASALDYLHGLAPPIVHRDIKPGNVILRSDGSFAFVDFGSVRDRLKPEGGSTVVGTFGYMAPEQFQGRSGPGSDVYAVGATALTLLTGRDPEELPHRGLAIDVPQALGRGADPDLVRILSAMLEPDPDRRAQVITPLLAERKRRAEREQKAERERRQRDSGGRQSSEREGFGEWFADDWREWEKEWDRWGKEWKRGGKKARRAARRERRSLRKLRKRQHLHGARSPLQSPFILAVVLLGLSIARVATWALFRVLLPTLLGTLAILFGPKLARAARRCSAVGMTGDEGLVHAIALVRERAARDRVLLVEQADDSAPIGRVRVATSSSSTRTEDESVEHSTADDESANTVSRARRASR